MFRGRYEHTVDTKGRLSIPAKYREVLLGKGDPRLIITNFVVSSKRCLDVYPLDEWSALEEAVRQRPRFDPNMLRFQTYYLGGAAECEVDAHGRILIPPTLRKYADLKRDVMVVSAGAKFRIWDKDAWDKVFTEAEEQLMEDAATFSDLGL